MFVFVVGDSLVSYLGGSRNAGAKEENNASAVAVEWDGGKLTNRQVSDLVFRRKLLNNFLRNIEMEGRRPSAAAGVDPPELRVQPLIGPETPQQGVEDNVVKTKLFAEAASDAGMKVSDETLLQYLDDLGRRNVSREQMRAMLRAAQQNRVTIDFVMDALREEMLARNYLSSNAFAFSTVTPEQRWKDWLRVNDRVVIEAAAVPAENYIADVKDPTEAELQVYFDKYKDREAVPDFVGSIELPSLTPGFRIPRKIDLQFIQANYDEFVNKAEAKVTEDEIAKHYNEHKDMFVKADTGLMEDKREKKDESKAEPPANKDAEKKSDDAATKGEEPKPAESPPAEAKKDAPAAPNDGESKTAPAEEKKSSQTNPPKNVFRLTAFQEKAETKEAPKSDASAETKKDEPADKAPASPPPAAPSATPSTPPAPPALAPLANVAADAAKASPPDEPKKPVEYQPLSEVKDQIRRLLAQNKVAEELKKLTDDIYGETNAEFTQWFNARIAAEEEKKDPPPAPKALTDLAPLAQKNGLQHGQTGPKTLLELRDLPIGKSSVTDTNSSLLGTLFLGGHELDVYQPTVSVDIDGNRYVVMKMSDTPDRIPTLAEVKDDVIIAWKKEKAAELAEKHANELAKKAQEAKSPLTSFFADDKSIKVVRTDPFAELTGGDVGFVGGQFQQQPYRISQPSDIAAVGPEFLKRVFELKDGEVAVIPNHDRSIEYIVRVAEHQPALPELRTAYLAEGNGWLGENVLNQMRRQEVFKNLENDIQLRSNLKWNRDKDPITQAEQRDGG